MINNKKIFIKIIGTVGLSYLLIKLIDNYKYFFNNLNLLLSLLAPFVIAFILAYILNPVVKFFENHLNSKRLVSLFLTYSLLIGLISIGIRFTVPSIISSLTDLASHTPTYIDQTQSFIVDLIENLQYIDPQVLKETSQKIMGLMPQISTILTGSIGQIFSATFSIGKFVAQLGLSFIICFYVLKDKEKFISFARKMIFIIFGVKFGEFTLGVCSNLNKNIGKYFSGKIIDSFLVGVLSGVGLFFIHSKYALLFGTLMGFMNLIPYFGPVIGMTPIFIINLFYNPTIAVFSILYLILVQQIEMAIIEPKIVGEQLDLSPFLTILAVTVGGGFFGIPGMILSVPIMGVIKTYFSEYLEYKHNKIISE